MKGTLTLLSLFPIIFFISCRSSTINENELISYNLTKLPGISDIKLSDLGFVDVQYIPLETNEESVISGAEDIYFPIKIDYGGNFFLLKRYNTILKFNNDGSFVLKIGTEGRGPYEYLLAHDIDIDQRNKNIFFLSRIQKKFLVYSESGEIIRTFSIPISPNQFRITNEGILCYSENHMGDILNSYDLIDFNGKIIKSFSNNYVYIKNDGAWGDENENIFYRFNGNLFKKEIYSDTVYQYKSEDFEPHLVIQVGEKLLTPQARSKFGGLDILKNYIVPSKLFEFGQYIYYEFTYDISKDISIYSFIGSRKNGLIAFYSTRQGIINDLDGGPNILPKTTLDNNTIIAIADAFKLKTYVKSDKFINSKPKYPEKKKELEKLADSLKETDNPVLVLVRLKK
jgi:hypothetical protein